MSATTAPPSAPSPAPSPPQVSSVAGLVPAQVEAIGAELDLIRQNVVESLGARDATYIRRLIAIHRALEITSRAVLLFARWRPAWWLGTAGLTVAKVLDNMEIGHNVLHGQWDWMRDPKINSTSWQWDHASPPEQWQRSHNQTHHRFTNIIGQDNDLGYGILRVTEEQPWRPRHLVQPLWNLVTACVFEWGVAMYDADLGAALRRDRDVSDVGAQVRAALSRARRLAVKDYLVHPLLAGPGWRSTFTAAVTANLVRNLWAHSVVMCGHFPEGVQTFEQETVAADETRGEWYVRQMLGSADISGSAMFHVLAGNLSHQIEHHLFPDLPSNRYAEIAREVRPVFARHGLSYHSRRFAPQLFSAWHRVIRLSLPNRGPGQS